MRAKFNALRDTALSFWSMRDARERRLLLICACFIFATLYYLLLIAPAITARTRLNRELPVLHQQVAQLQAVANEVVDLNNKRSDAVPDMNADNLARALVAHGLKAKSLNVTEQNALLTMEKVSYAQTLALLDELKQTLRVDVIDAKFTTLEKADMVDASLTLHQAGKP
jgi:general secretion pathway protein M